jgi:hypothetical protein
MTLLLLTDPTHPGCVSHQRSRARTRLWGFLHSHRLDVELACGTSPDSSAALSLRANTLIGTTTRAALARSLRRLVAEAGRPVGPVAPPVPICWRKVLRARQTIEQLAERLGDGAPVDARGMAQVNLLLTEGWGPVYARPASDDLEAALRRALEALEPPL